MIGAPLLDQVRHVIFTDVLAVDGSAPFLNAVGVCAESVQVAPFLDRGGQIGGVGKRTVFGYGSQPDFHPLAVEID
jgi:hypothetical protein